VVAGYDNIFNWTYHSLISHFNAFYPLTAFKTAEAMGFDPAVFHFFASHARRSPYIFPAPAWALCDPYGFNTDRTIQNTALCRPLLIPGKKNPHCLCYLQVHAMCHIAAFSLNL